MKIRNGFVSNSSSSSFVVCPPDNLKFSDEAIQRAYETLIVERVVYEGEADGIFELLTTALRPYVIASFDVGSDCGEIVLADKAKIRKVLGITNE